MMKVFVNDDVVVWSCDEIVGGVDGEGDKYRGKDKFIPRLATRLVLEQKRDGAVTRWCVRPATRGSRLDAIMTAATRRSNGKWNKRLVRLSFLDASKWDADDVVAIEYGTVMTEFGEIPKLVALDMVPLWIVLSLTSLSLLYHLSMLQVDQHYWKADALLP